MQGPNYAVAKLIQRWRMLWALEQGLVVSANVAPASLTRSVLHNRLIAAGMYGANFFGVEPFETATSSALMTLLLLSDLRQQQQDKQQGNKASLAHPLQLFETGAVHAGAWRAPFTTNSYVEVAGLVHLLRLLRPVLLAAGAGLGVYTLSRRSRL